MAIYEISNGSYIAKIAHSYKKCKKKIMQEAVKEYPDDMEKYDTIFLVYPNWWNTIPMVVATFLGKYEWSGKTIIPVCTNEGSGLKVN